MNTILALSGGIGAALVTALFLYLGNRVIAKSSKEVGSQQVEVEQRKVDQEAFDRFVQRYEADRQRQDEDLEETRTELQETRNLLRAALKHINLLRGEVRRANVPLPPLPGVLETIPWGLLGDGDLPDAP